MPENERPEDKPSTYMVIPYAPGDQGRPIIDRPVKPPAISYLCPSIQVLVGGVPSPPVFVPGDELEVQVTVANYGGGTMNALANIAVFWADPNSGFSTTNWFGQSPLVVPSRGGIRTTPSIRNTIPSTAPKHICLLARVTAPGDYLPLGSTINPANDRHWAQLNLNAVVLAANGTFHFTFRAGNPLDHAADFDILVRPANRQNLQSLARYLRAEPVAIEDISLDLLAVESDFMRSATRRRGANMSVSLPPHGNKPIHLTGTLHQSLNRSQFTAVEVIQTTRDEEQRPIGSMAIVLTNRR